MLMAGVLTQVKSDQLRSMLDLRAGALLLASSFVLIAVVCLNSARWLLVSRLLNLTMTAQGALRWTFIGHFFNQMLPTSIGGDVVRAILAARGTNDGPGSVASVALERGVGVVALLIMIACGQPFLIARLNDASASYVAIAVTILGVIAVAGVLTLDKLAANYLPQPLRRTVLFVSSGVRKLIAAPKLSGAVLLLSFAMQGTTLALTAVIANQLGASVSLFDIVLIVPTIILVSSLPISIGGWGVREAGFAVGFVAIGQPASAAIAASIFLGVANLLSAVPGGILWASHQPASAQFPEGGKLQDAR